MKRPFLLLLLSVNLFGATATWNVDSNGSWEVNGNWTPMTFPNGNSDTAILSNVITGNRTITLGIPITLEALNIDDNNSYRLQSNQLIFESSSGTPMITITNVNGNGAHRISSAIQLNETLEISQGAVSTLLIDGLISGPGGLTKTGSGILRVNVQNNTYTGVTRINEGTYNYTQRGAIPNGGVTILGDGGGASPNLIINRSMSGASGINLTINSNGTLI